MADASTVNRAVPYPNSEDLVHEGPQEMERIAKAIDEENAGQVDYLQPGVVGESDWSFTATINSSTAALSSEANTGGIAWIDQAAIGLMRTVTPTGSAITSIAVGTKPSSGKYMTVGIEITPTTWGKGVMVSTVSGSEQNTKVAAEEHSPAVTANKIRVRDVVIKNTSAVYSIEGQTDRRRFAGTGSWVNLALTSPIEVWNVTPQQRFEINDVVRLQGAVINGSSIITAGTTLFTMQYKPSAERSWTAWVEAPGGNSVSLRFIIAPATGVVTAGNFPHSGILFLDGVTYTI